MLWHLIGASEPSTEASPEMSPGDAAEVLENLVLDK
jgi:hypothetical protein